jgi:hypothetical protein
VNIFLIPYTPVRHTAVAVVCAAMCLIAWWAVLALAWSGPVWTAAWDGPIFLGALAGAAGGGSVLAEGSLRRWPLWRRVLFAILGWGSAWVFALAFYALWSVLLGPAVLSAELADPSLVSLRFRLVGWLAAGFGAGVGPMIVRRFKGGLSHLVGGLVAGFVGGLVWYVFGYKPYNLGTDLFMASALAATSFGFAYGLFTWGVPDELYAGWLRVLTVTRHARRIPINAPDGSPRERFVGHFPRGLDLFLPAEDGVMELHVSVLLNRRGEFRARGLTLQPTAVQRFMERVDLSYDKRRPAPLDTRLASGDRIVMGPPGRTTVVEFLMLPREER